MAGEFSGVRSSSPSFDRTKRGTSKKKDIKLLMAAEPPLTCRASQRVSHHPVFARIHSPNSEVGSEDSGVVAEQTGSTKTMDSISSTRDKHLKPTL